MCINSVYCPLCCQMTFSNIDTLRIRLIKAANGPLNCPICKEIMIGLDKLTIHLFSHTNIMTTDEYNTINLNGSCKSNDKNIIDHNQKQKLIRISKEDVNRNHIMDSSKDQKPTMLLTLARSTPVMTGTVASLSKNTNTIVCQGDKQLQQQQHLQEQQKFICDICELIFNSNDILKIHNKLVHKISDHKTNNIMNISNKDHSRFQCNFCSKIFKMKGSLRIHLKVVHAVSNDLKLMNAFEKAPEKDDEMKVIPASTMAIGPTMTTTALISSEQQNNNSQIQIIHDGHQEFVIKPITISIPNINENIYQISKRSESTEINSDGFIQNSNDISPKNTFNSESQKLWECDVCSKSFTTKYFLKKHKRLHTGEMPYTCELCGKTFTFQQSYHKHLLYHSDEKPHSCSTCGRAFKELSTLHNHERIHSGEKPFKCENCGKCFRQRVSYLVHKRIHTGVMPYKCSICDKSFRYKVSQRTHKCIGFLQQQHSSTDTASVFVGDSNKNSLSLKAASQQTTSTSSPTATSSTTTTDLLQDLLQAASIIPSEDINDIDDDSNENHVTANNDGNNNNKCNTSVELNDKDLEKSIDEIVAEQCDKMGIKSTTDSDNTNLIKEEIDKGIPLPSPSEKLQSLCLYSPENQSTSFMMTNIEPINEDTFKQLLFNVDDNW